MPQTNTPSQAHFSVIDQAQNTVFFNNTSNMMTTLTRLKSAIILLFIFATTLSQISAAVLTDIEITKIEISDTLMSSSMVDDGAALALNNGYVEMGIVIPQNSSYTKEMWVYLRASGTNNVYSSNKEPFWIQNDHLKAGTEGAGIHALISPNTLPLNTWIHIAVSWDNVTKLLVLYENGVEVATRASVLTYSGGAIDIGHHNGGAGLANVIVDDIRIWNTSRSCADVAVGVNCELTGNEPGLIAYYKMNQGLDGSNNTGITQVIDASGNNNHGTFSSGFTLTGTDNNFVAPGAVTTGVTCAAALITVEGNNIVIANGDVTPSSTDDTEFESPAGGSTSLQSLYLR